MGNEIERKFLLKDDDASWRNHVESKLDFKQGYFEPNASYSMRVRLAGDRAYLTIKGGAGLVRSEYEYEIPFEDGEGLLVEFCEERLIEKTRYVVSFDGHKWEIDEYHGENAGLFVCELELADAQEDITLPPWVSNEITGEEQYANEHLASHPYNTWTPRRVRKRSATEEELQF